MRRSRAKIRWKQPLLTLAALTLLLAFDGSGILRVGLGCAVRVNMMLGTWESYDFMTSRLGFTTLTQSDSEQVGAMALGGYAKGVTTEEMAAAYGAFVNEGIYTKPRTFTRVEDSNGNVILENEIQSNVAMKASTAAQASRLTAGPAAASRSSCRFVIGRPRSRRQRPKGETSISGQRCHKRR